MKFIHITDLHLIKEDVLLHGLNPYRRFEKCIDDINKNHSDAECCVITGDLADAGEAEAYALLQSELARCNVPCHILICNHDARDRVLDQFNTIEEDANGFLQSSIQTSAGLFLLLDTVQSGTHSGQYCHNRRKWLEDQLADNQHQDVFLFMHHPPFDINLPCLDKIGLQEQDKFAETIAPFRNGIRHLFFGHAHRPIYGNWHGISYSSIRGTNHQVTLDFDTPEIIYIDEPPEYAVVFVEQDRVVIHSHTYSLSS